MENRPSPTQNAVNLVGEDTVFEGTIRAESDVRISGRIIGTLNVQGNTIVAEGGIVEGEFIATNAEIAGHVQGEIKVKERLVLKSSALVDGRIDTDRLVVEEGARFTGECTMGASTSTGRMTEDRPEGEGPVVASIYLPEDASHFQRETLVNAVGRFMEAMGFEPEQEDEPIPGSWYQKLLFRVKDFFSRDEVEKAYEEGKDALRSYIEGSTAAEQTSELAAATAGLIESLEDTPNATIRLGNLILLKQTVSGEPRIHTETVSPSLMRELESRDLFKRDPKEVKDFIEERQSVTGTSASE